MIVAGIDAGGSKTECIILDSKSNNIITRAETGPANYQVVGLEKAFREIAALTPKIMKLAENGDTAAKKIIHQKSKFLKFFLIIFEGI
ncbi:MAG: BadF/BadG/BcrA/BcrD ATPase family protein [Halanaerobium sp.]